MFSLISGYPVSKVLGFSNVILLSPNVFCIANDDCWLGVPEQFPDGGWLPREPNWDLKDFKKYYLFICTFKILDNPGEGRLLLPGPVVLSNTS